MANRAQRLSRTSSKQCFQDDSKNEGNISGINGLYTVPNEVRIVVEYFQNLWTDFSPRLPSSLQPDWLREEVSKLPKEGKMIGHDHNVVKCCSRRTCHMILAVFLLLIVGACWSGTLLVRDVYPEYGTWMDNLCPHSDIWVDSKARERVLKHYPALDNPFFRAAESVAYGYRDTFGPGPIEVKTDLVVLVATHHKTGYVMNCLAYIILSSK